MTPPGNTTRNSGVYSIHYNGDNDNYDKVRPEASERRSAQSADVSQQKTSAKLKVKEMKNTKNLLKNQGGKVQTSWCRQCYINCHGGK